jgi:hypothetical protein
VPLSQPLAGLLFVAMAWYIISQFNLVEDEYEAAKKDDAAAEDEDVVEEKN